MVKYPSKNMKPHEIVILTILIIAALYLLLVITDLIFVFTFNSILKKHNKSLSVILNTKYDNLKKILLIFEKLNIKINENILANFNKIKLSDLNKQYTASCKTARDTLSILRNEVLFVASNNPVLEKHNEFLMAKENILELDDVYRVNIAMYNADILGYNYWVRFLPCRYIFLLAKIKTKELI